MRLGSINQYEGDNVEPSAQSDTIFELYSVPCYEQKYPEIVAGEKIGSAKKSVKKNDVLLCKINPRINRVWKVEQYTEHPLIASGEWAIIRNPDIFADYLMRYFQAPVFRKYLLSNVSGVGGSLMRARPKFIDIYPVPLPPRVEQERIVACIEELFEKLDAAEEKLRAVVEGSPARRAALLRRAFTGDLTKNWRAAHGQPEDLRKEKTIREICKSLKYGTAKKAYSTGSVVVLRMGNLQNGEIDWSDLAYTDDKEDIEKYSLKPGDVLFNRTNSAALVGKTSIYRGERPAVYAGYLIKLDYGPEIIGDYLNYMLNSPQAKTYCNAVKSDGVNQSNINAQKIGAFQIPVPPLDEQEEIVRLLDELLAREEAARAAADAALAKIPALRQAVLARAFRGQLGTNDPAEPPALSE